MQSKLCVCWEGRRRKGKKSGREGLRQNQNLEEVPCRVDEGLLWVANEALQRYSVTTLQDMRGGSVGFGRVRDDEVAGECGEG